MTPLQRLKRQHDDLKAKIQDLLDVGIVEKRDFTSEENTRYAKLIQEEKDLRVKIRDAEEDEDPPVLESRGVRSRPPGQAPAIGRSDADQPGYSFLRAIQLSAEGRPLDGLEGEVHQEVVRNSGGRAFKGFGVPSSSNPATLAMMHPAQARQIMQQMERRDLTTTTGAGSIFVVPKSFIDYLRNRLVVLKLGVEILEDMHGNFAIPRQTGTNTVQWVGEGLSATPTNPTFDQVPFVPHLAIASTVITKQLMMQTSFSADEKVKGDLAAAMANEFDRVIFFGSGGAQPPGLFNNPIIQANSASLQGGTNGAPLSYQRIVQMKKKIASFNAAVINMAYVTNTDVEGDLRMTLKQAPGQAATVSPTFVWEDTPDPEVGRVAGYRALSTNLIPNTLTKGSSANCSGIILGNWADLTVATWDTGVDVIVDPYTGKRAGTVEITTEMAMDSHPKHETSFAIISDATPLPLS